MLIESKKFLKWTNMQEEENKKKTAADAEKISRLDEASRLIHQANQLQSNPGSDRSLDKENEKRFHTDWQNLGRYRNANTTLAKITSTKPRVVFTVANVRTATHQLRKRGFKVQKSPHAVSVTDPDGAVIVFVAATQGTGSQALN